VEELARHAEGLHEQPALRAEVGLRPPEEALQPQVEQPDAVLVQGGEVDVHLHRRHGVEPPGVGRQVPVGVLPAREDGRQAPPLAGPVLVGADRDAQGLRPPLAGRGEQLSPSAADVEEAGPRAHAEGIQHEPVAARVRLPDVRLAVEHGGGVGGELLEHEVLCRRRDRDVLRLLHPLAPRVLQRVEVRVDGEQVALDRGEGQEEPAVVMTQLQPMTAQDAHQVDEHGSERGPALGRHPVSLHET
jgi:hypothetical protein